MLRPPEASSGGPLSMKKGTAMTNEEIYDLMDRFERSTLQSLKLSQEGFTIELCRAAPAPAAPVPAAVRAGAGKNSAFPAHPIGLPTGCSFFVGQKPESAFDKNVTCFLSVLT